MKNLLFVLMFIPTIFFGQIKGVSNDANFVNSTSLTVPISFQHLGKDEGLPKNLGHIKQDKKGFLWIDSIDGIYRYDGTEFKAFKHDSTDPDGLSNNFIREVFIDRSDHIWAITIDNLLYRFNPALEKFKKLTLIPDPTDDPGFVKATYLYEDSYGIIWLGTANHGLNRLNPLTGQLSREDLGADLANQYFLGNTFLLEDRQGNLWGAEKNLFCILFQKNRTVKQVISYPELGESIIRALAEDPQGGMWAMGLTTEIIRLQPKTRVVQRFSNPLKKKELKIGDYVNEIFWESPTSIWIASTTGLNLFNPMTGDFTAYRSNLFDPNSLSNDQVIDVYIDKTKGLWATTWGGGLNYYNFHEADFGHFSTITFNKNTLTSNKVCTFYEDVNRMVWIGTENGLNKFNPQTGRIDQYSFKDLNIESPENSILSITETTASLFPAFGEKLLLGTKGGLIFLDKNSGQFSKWSAPSVETKPIEDNYVYSIVRDENDILWAFTYYPHQVFQYNNLKKTFSPFDLIYENDTLVNPPQLVADKQYSYWIGTEDKGLFQLDLTQQRLRHYNILSNESETFPATIIRSFWKDRQNRQWIGTDKGLYLLIPTEKKETYTFQRITEADGLQGLSIKGILEDQFGMIWLSTSNGVSKLNPTTMVFQNYTPSDGLQSNEFFFDASYKSPTMDLLYFGGLNGFNVFNPADIQKDTLSFPVTLTGVEVFRDFSMQQIILNDSVGNPSIELFYGDKLLQINYAALHFADPKLNQYAIQLEGYDADWRYIGNQTEVTYTNLDAGNYVFRVKGSNKDGVWNKAGTSMKVIVHPPWWATWWAYAAYLLAIFSSLYYLYRLQLQRQQEQLEASRLKEMDSLKTQFFANVSHELRTPLTLILGPISTILKRNKLEHQDFTILKLAQQSGQQLHRLINSILDFSHLEVGQLELQESPVAFYPFIRRLIAQFESNAQMQGIQLSFDYQSNPYLQLQLDSQKFEIIVNNLLSNALKFTPTGGKIEVQIQDLQHKIQLKVADTGRGIHPKDLPRIFDRFYQTKQTNMKIEGGSGIGLALSREYVQLFKGELRAESELDQGSTFYFTFPKKEILGVIEKELLDHESEAMAALKNQKILAKTLVATNIPEPNKKATILLVEDNHSLRQYIEFVLSDRYHVLTAENGQIALDMLVAQTSDHYPSLIVSDIMMPVMDGFELLEKLKSDQRWRQVPIIMLTARAEFKDKLKALRIGVDDYLLKPFEQDELVARIDNLLRNYQERQLAIQHPEFIENPYQADAVAPPKIKEEEEAIIKPEWLENLEQIVEDQLTDINFSIDELATQLNVSRRTFYRMMKTTTGLTPNQYLREVRLQKARRLIENGQLQTIKEIAQEVGFQKTAYFSDLFKQRFGKTPSEYLDNQ